MNISFFLWFFFIIFVGIVLHILFRFIDYGFVSKILDKIKDKFNV